MLSSNTSYNCRGTGSWLPLQRHRQLAGGQLAGGQLTASASAIIVSSVSLVDEALCGRMLTYADVC